MKYFAVLIVFIFISCHSKTLQENNPIIGSKTFEWKDNDRVDPYYGGNRIINIQVWYPGDNNQKIEGYENSDYYYEIDTAYSKLENWLEDDYNFVSNIQTKSYVNFPISKDQSKHPVLLLSPSLGGNLSMYSYYAEFLAQKGFVVVGINHLYESEYVILEKEDVYPSNLRFHDSLKSLKIPEEITAEKYREVKSKRLKVLGNDLVFCLNQLDKINEIEFNGKLDFQKVGAFGHSVGGAASIYASIMDKRITAVVNIDGTPPSVALKNGINVPFMFIEDLTDYQNHQGYKKMHQRRSDFCELNTNDSFRVLIGEANHNSFLDLNYFLAQNMNDKRKAFKVIKETATYLNKFFGQYLKNENIEIKEIKTDSLEVIKYVN